ncbi:NlpC/P60 family protein, partial [Clostridioides difficile]
TSKAQSKYGQTVSKANLQPGDLVFFTTNGSGSVSHVGIYVGGAVYSHMFSI